MTRKALQNTHGLHLARLYCLVSAESIAESKALLRCSSSPAEPDNDSAISPWTPLGDRGFIFKGLSESEDKRRITPCFQCRHAESTLSSVIPIPKLGCGIKDAGLPPVRFHFAFPFKLPVCLSLQP